MAEKSRGSLHGSRKKLSRSGSATTVNEYLKEFSEGETALVKIEPSAQEGRPHIRFHGRTVTVKGKRGDSYEVEFQDGGKTKTLFLPPVHLKKLEE